MTPELRISNGIHKIANADILIDGVKYPCHHSSIDNQNPMYGNLHAKRKDLSTNIVVPAFDRSGSAYNLYAKLTDGAVYECTSRKSPALSHRFRVSSLAQDEASVTLRVTDDRR